MHAHRMPHTKSVDAIAVFVQNTERVICTFTLSEEDIKLQTKNDHNNSYNNSAQCNRDEICRFIVTGFICRFMSQLNFALKRCQFQLHMIVWRTSLQFNRILMSGIRPEYFFFFLFFEEINSELIRYNIFNLKMTMNWQKSMI